MQGAGTGVNPQIDPARARQAGYDGELRFEQGYVDGLYAKLDDERAQAKARYGTALRNDGETPMDRDVELRALGKRIKRLDVADDGLCFGRLDSLSGERSYIGRIGLLDENNEYQPLLLDWRAPAARAFYTATAPIREKYGSKYAALIKRIEWAELCS